MGLTTEEEEDVPFFFLSVFFSFRCDGRPNGDLGRRWVGEGRTWPKEAAIGRPMRETLETRVNRIEEKPWVVFNSVMGEKNASI